MNLKKILIFHVFFLRKFFQKFKNGQKKCPIFHWGNTFVKNENFVTEKILMLSRREKVFQKREHNF